ncbi:hypothetical protein JIN84_09020 [Luteolibacter yonseiensis]|uniref:AAA domain-containing protein n=1 Tax=Luteolibacter yonseiensis TaxID=1144680 RepID=A0A934R2S1_9BACT|nr:hypothetical protein [Luteolibacter yonseiensis]MBK1815757.1 hypothetical protein [Luteolibacter yonseiensis]
MTPPTTNIPNTPATLNDSLFVDEDVISGIQAGEFGILDGPAYITSHLMLRAAVEIAIGWTPLKGMFGLDCVGGQSVVYLTLKDTPSSRTRRLVGLLGQLDIQEGSNEAQLLKDNLIICDANAFMAGGLEALPVDPENPPRLIIIDDVAHFVPNLDFNDPSAVGDFLRTVCAEASRHGAALLLVRSNPPERGGSLIEDTARRIWTVTHPEQAEAPYLPPSELELVGIVSSIKSNDPAVEEPLWFGMNSVDLAIDQPEKTIKAGA